MVGTVDGEARAAVEEAEETEEGGCNGAPWNVLWNVTGTGTVLAGSGSGSGNGAVYHVMVRGMPPKDLLLAINSSAVLRIGGAEQGGGGRGVFFLTTAAELLQTVLKCIKLAGNIFVFTHRTRMQINLPREETRYRQPTSPV